MRGGAAGWRGDGGPHGVDGTIRGDGAGRAIRSDVSQTSDEYRPVHLDLDRTKGLSVEWSDGRRSFYPIDYLRRLSPSAEMRELREEMARNPLTVLPASYAKVSGPLEAVSADLVGNYAVRITFSDGHHTGLYSWAYLRAIDPSLQSRE